MNEKRIYRLYREERLQLRKKMPRRRVKAALRNDRAPPSRANEVWSMDFVHDQLATGRKMRVLTVVDAFSRYSPVLDARFAYRGEDVVRTLDQTCRRTGYPKRIRVDQGSEFISRDLDLWAYQHDVTLDFSRPGKPRDNAFIESFNGKFRAECLNAHWFLGLEDAREKLEAWRRDYNELRPHSVIGNTPPAELHDATGASSPPDQAGRKLCARMVQSWVAPQHLNSVFTEPAAAQTPQLWFQGAGRLRSVTTARFNSRWMRSASCPRYGEQFTLQSSEQGVMTVARSFLCVDCHHHWGAEGAGRRKSLH